MEFQTGSFVRGLRCGVRLDGGEQQFFADKNFKNEPKRCKACKASASRPAAVAGAVETVTQCSAWKGTTVPSSRRRDARSSARNASSPGNSPGRGRLAFTGLFHRQRSARRAGGPCRLACGVLSSRRHILERFPCRSRTKRRRRGRARPQRQGHAGGRATNRSRTKSQLVNQGMKIILNLADVPYVDSAGLGEIVRTYTTVSKNGGSLKLLNLTKRITDLLAITKLLTVFETFDAESDAVRSFSASAQV